MGLHSSETLSIIQFSAIRAYYEEKFYCLYLRRNWTILIVDSFLVCIVKKPELSIKHFALDALRDYEKVCKYYAKIMEVINWTHALFSCLVTMVTADKYTMCLVYEILQDNTRNTLYKTNEGTNVVSDSDIDDSKWFLLMDFSWKTSAGKVVVLWRSAMSYYMPHCTWHQFISHHTYTTPHNIMLRNTMR